MLQPRFQVSLVAEEQLLHCFSGLRANFAKFSFQNTHSGPPSESLATARITVTRSGPPSLWRHGLSHSGSRAARVTHCDLSQSSKRSGQPCSLVPARVTRSGPPLMEDLYEFLIEFMGAVRRRTISDGARPFFPFCSRATCLTVSRSIWQSYNANTCHLDTHIWNLDPIG